MMAISVAAGRDPKWLMLEVCREFQRGTCLRSSEECKFAHPAPSCHVESGCVVACFDSLKGRCTRENCKYLHPPPHLRTQLEINGRNNLIQQKNVAAMLAHQMQLVLPGAQFQPITTFPSVTGSQNFTFGPYLGQAGSSLGLVPELVAGGSLLPAVGAVSPAPKPLRSDKLEVCREFQRGTCVRGESECRFAHPTEALMVDNSENSVIVCMDYVKGHCVRDRCKYFHPPAHLQARIRASQQHTGQTSALTSNMALSPAALMSLPKRLSLEKSNGSTPLLSSGLFHYQQALTSMHLQQHTFIPPDPVKTQWSSGSATSEQH